MRRANRTILLSLCLILALSACAAADEPPAEPAQSTPYSGIWTLQSIPLFDNISLEEDLGLQVLGGSRGAVLVAVEGRLPETSPYYDDVRLENGLTVYTDRVHLVSFPEGEVLRTVA